MAPVPEEDRAIFQDVDRPQRVKREASRYEVRGYDEVDTLKG